MPTASKTETNENTSADSGVRSEHDGVSSGNRAEASRGVPALRHRRSKRAPRRSAASCSSGSAAGPSRGNAPGGKSGSSPATLDDPLVRVQLFRFIDVLPALQNDDSVRRHLAEYLAEAGDRVPWWLSMGLRLAPAGTAAGGMAGRGGAGCRPV